MRPMVYVVLMCLVTLLVILMKGEQTFLSEFQPTQRNCASTSSITTATTPSLKPASLAAPLKHIDQNTTSPTVNVLLCLSGDGYGFLEETKVAIKSLILNAPHTGELNIYIMADQPAYDALPIIFNTTLPSGTIWWCPIAFHIINVESETKGWIQEILNISAKEPLKTLFHTWGTYYRLFFNRYLPSSVDYILYIDSDTIVTANLAHLWNYTENSGDDWLFSWRSETAGFILLRNLPELWNLATQVNENDLPSEHFSDQKILRLIALRNPSVAAQLPAAWGMHWAWDWKKRKTMAQAYPQLAMGHFNGGSSTQGAFWNGSLKATLDVFHDEWGSFFYYYIHMPWTFARFIGESSAVGGGYPVSTNFHPKAKALVSSAA
jgi:hypothetical protein